MSIAFPPQRLLPALAALLAVSLASAAELAPVPPDGWRQDVAALAATPHRLAGREEGSRAAGRYVERRLRELGVDEVYTQEFPVVVPRMTECELEAGGRSYPIHALQPNCLQAAVTPAGGLEGETVYLGRGTGADFARDPRDKIAVFDFDCGKEWLTAFAFGAKAVLFVETPAACTARPVHHVSLPANLPRFYVPAAMAAALQFAQAPQRVRLKAACQWESLRGRNVIGVIRGPGLPTGAPRQAIVLAAALDAWSEVPELSAGARAAANAAALLQVAGYMASNRPSRDVVVAFFDGQGLNQAGARAFYGALHRRMGSRKLAESLESRLEMAREEETHVRELLAVARTGDLLQPAARALPGHAEALRLARGVALGRSSEIMAQLAPLRIALERLKREAAEGRPQAAAELEQLSSEGAALGLVDRLQADELAWNSVVRLIGEGAPPDRARIQALSERLMADSNPERQRLKRELFEGGLLAHLAEAAGAVRASCEARLGELSTRQADIAADMALSKALGSEPQNIALHVTLNLGDEGSGWSFVHGDNLNPAGQDSEGLYSGLYRALRETGGLLGPTAAFDPRPVSGLYPSRLFAPAPLADSGGIARMFAHFNLSVVTLFDPQAREGMPADRLDALNLERFATQVSELGPFVRALSAHEALTMAFPNRADVVFKEERWTGGKSVGVLTRQGDVGDPLQTAALPGTLVALVGGVSQSRGWSDVFGENAPPGIRGELILRSQSNGILEIPPSTPSATRVLLAAGFDPGGRGVIERVTPAAELFSTPGSRYVNLIRVNGVTLTGFGYERRAATIAMRARSTSRVSENSYLACEGGNLLCLFFPVDAPAAKLFNREGMVLLENRPTPGECYGRGVPVSDPFARVDISEYTSADLLSLNTYRLALLSSKGIREHSLNRLNGRARELREEAATVRGQGSERHQATLAASAAFSRRVHGPLVAAMNDLVTALVLLLLLSIPFAFALERLLVGTPHVYRRLGWFGFFFLLTFGLLYAVNPAFKLAATPVIIFLAFAVILLSLLVIMIMIRKLQTELKRLQGLSAAAHSVDVSRVSTMAAAVNMGISTMRRRPVRTVLTAATVVLLTFTILTFASFSSAWGARSSYVGPLPEGPPRVLVRTLLWTPLSLDMLASLRGLLAGRALVAPRYWVAPAVEEVAAAMRENRTLGSAVVSGDGRRLAPVAAAVGIDPGEWRSDPSLASCLEPDVRRDLLETNGIAFSRAVSDALGLGPADIGKTEVVFQARRLIYAGCLNSRFGSQPLLDGSSQLPVDYRASVPAGSPDGRPVKEQLAAAGQSAALVPFALDGVVVISAAQAESLGGRLSALTLYPADCTGIDAMAEDVATITGHPTYVGSDKGVYRLLFSTIVQASGFRDLVIPVLLGGLIIFATMLGSVADREREIHTFSSLGLAPPHVATLFFAESAIYAVIGGLGGYLLGQLAAAGMGVLTRYVHGAIPTMNFSSMNAVVTIFIVMGIVMLSTLYPAIRASRSANPGLQRSWVLPRPAGDLYDIRFPFTVSDYDLVGIISYLDEHFGNYTDASVGAFATLERRVFRQPEGLLGFKARVALAPFDLGIEQEVTLLSQPSDVEGIDEVRLLLHRTSGAYSDWQRANREFVGDLRRQFLVWRTLGADTAEIYRERTLSRWDALPVERGLGERSVNGSEVTT